MQNFAGVNYKHQHLRSTWILSLDLFIPPRCPDPSSGRRSRLSRPPLHLQISALAVDIRDERLAVTNSVGTFGWFEIWRFLSACLHATNTGVHE